MPLNEWLQKLHMETNKPGSHIYQPRGLGQPSWPLCLCLCLHHMCVVRITRTIYCLTHDNPSKHYYSPFINVPRLGLLLISELPVLEPLDFFNNKYQNIFTVFLNQIKFNLTLPPLARLLGYPISEHLQGCKNCRMYLIWKIWGTVISPLQSWRIAQGGVFQSGVRGPGTYGIYSFPSESGH